MEEKLQKLRQQRRREYLWDVLTLKNLINKWTDTSKNMKSPETSVLIPNSSINGDSGSSSRAPSPTNLSRTLSNDSITSTLSDWSFSNVTISRLNLITYIVYTLLWLTCWLIAVQLRFGAVFCLLSGLIGIYLNTRTEARQPGELSAYSVFNPNCEAIDGTLKAEQFEKEFNLIHHSPS